MNLSSLKPSREEFFDHALRDAERPPFVRPERYLSRRPRCQQRIEILPAVLSLPDLKASSSNQ